MLTNQSIISKLKYDLNDSLNILYDINVCTPTKVSKNVLSRLIKYFNTTIDGNKYDLKQIVIHKLSGSINLHEDVRFAESIRAKNAFVYVEHIGSNISKSEYDGKFNPEFLKTVKGKIVAEEIKYVGQLIPFDPKKNHGLLSNNELVIIVFWTSIKKEYI